MALAATYQAAFAVDYDSSRLASSGERSGIRVIDPASSMVRTYGSADELHSSAFDQPGLKVLLDQMSGQPELYLVTPLTTLTQRATGLFQDVSSDALAIIGDGPAFLPKPAADDPLTLWGSLEVDYQDFPEVTDQSIGSVAMEQVSSTAPTVHYVDGSGRRRSSDGRSLVLVAPEAAAVLGAPLTATSDLLDGFVCACDVDQLHEVTATMNAAEADGQSARRFYAVSHTDFRTPLLRSYALTSVLTAAFAALSVLALLTFSLAAAGVFWNRNRAA